MNSSTSNLKTISDEQKRDILRKLSYDLASGKSESKFLCYNFSSVLTISNYLGSLNIASQYFKLSCGSYHLIVDLYCNSSSVIKASCNFEPTMSSI